MYLQEFVKSLGIEELADEEKIIGTQSKEGSNFKKGYRLGKILHLPDGVVIQKFQTVSTSLKILFFQTFQVHPQLRHIETSFFSFSKIFF